MALPLPGSPTCSRGQRASWTRRPPRNSAAAGARLAPCRFVRRRRRTGHRRRIRDPTRLRPDGISSASSTSPVRGSIRRTSLSSPSEVPCQSSPSTQVTPVTKRLRLDRAQDRPRLGIDLVDLAVAILPDPERAFGPGEPRIAAAAGRRDRGEHAAGLRIDLLDAILGDLEQVPAVEGRSGMRGDVERARQLAARRIEGVELVAGCEPDMPAVEGDAMHLVDAREGSVFAEDFGG